MSSNCRNVAKAVGGKTARACDSCIKKRARWYCAADDAFLCQGCDASVHSANPLARRHERVRLKTASFKPSSSNTESLSENHVPSWQRGFTRKARTPRKAGKPTRHVSTSLSLVPEVGADEISHEENEEDQLLYNYRVPIYDPFVAAAELCTSDNSNELAEKTTASATNDSNGSESEAVLACHNGDVDHSLHGFLPSDMDLADFAADVQSLLGRGLENESFAMEELGLVDYREKNLTVKIEEEEGVVEFEGAADINEECKVFDNNKDDSGQIDLEREPFELNFDYDSPATCGDEDEKIVKGETVTSGEEGCEDDDVAKNKNKKKRKKLLSLDYEAVIAAWASQGTSPWTTGDRPDIDPDECWPDYMGTWGHNYGQNPYGGMGRQLPGTVDGGREARVSRYREKRRTRLFSKKIRYEVRKLNAEKRPRMKGRFVKRASFAAPPAFPLFNKTTITS